MQRYPLQLEWVINQYFEIDHYQPLLFVVDSFDHLFELVDQLERWMREGKLDNVAARGAGGERGRPEELPGGRRREVTLRAASEATGREPAPARRPRQ